VQIDKYEQNFKSLKRMKLDRQESERAYKKMLKMQDDPTISMKTQGRATDCPLENRVFCGKTVPLAGKKRPDPSLRAKPGARRDTSSNWLSLRSGARMTRGAGLEMRRLQIAGHPPERFAKHRADDVRSAGILPAVSGASRSRRRAGRMLTPQRARRPRY
jgi:hypothetical protein